MQKVSKQSLAMLALSILLAISIALTFTFAALNSTKTATGTITFTGEMGLIYAGTDVVDKDLTFTIQFGSTGQPTVKLTDQTATALSAVSLKLAETSKNVASVSVGFDFFEGADQAAGDVDAALTALIDVPTESYDNEGNGFRAGDTVIDNLESIFTFSNVETLNSTQFKAVTDATGTLTVKVTFTANA